MYKAATSSSLPPHSNSSVGLHSVALSQPTITTPLVLLLSVGGVVFSSMQACHTYSAVWAIHVSMALQYSLAVVYGTGSEVSVHRQRVGGFHPGCTCGVKGKLCNGLRRCIAARSEWAHLNPWLQTFGWDCSHQTHEGNYTNSWTFSTFVHYVSAGMTTKQMKLFIAGYKSHDIMRSTPIGCRNEWTGSSSSQ